MVGVHAIPAAIVRLKRVMRPAITGIGTGNNDVLPGEAERPYLGRVRVIDPWLDRLRTLEEGRRFIDGAMLREVIVDTRIAFHSRHFGPGRQRLRNFAVTLHQNCINDVKGLMFDAAFAQPLQNWFLGGLSLVQQSVIYVAPLLCLAREVGGLAQVSLLSEYDEKFCLLTIGSMFHYPRRDLVRSSEPVPWRI